MASVLKRRNGTFDVQFLNRRKRRKTLAVGTQSRKQAEYVKDKVENILTAEKLS